MKLFILAALCTAPLWSEGCRPVSGDRILGRDLALAEPAFAPLPATMTIAYAPAPGTRRVFAQVELARIARANNLKTSVAEDICFEVPLHALEEKDVLAAMRRSLPADAQLTVVEWPKVSVPDGPVEFPLNGLEPDARGARIWRGWVRYGEALRMQIRARVNVSRRIDAVVAIKNLTPGIPIDASQIRIETVGVPVEANRAVAARLEDVRGRMPSKALPAGATIPLSVLEAPPAVRRGDPVKVEVRSGLACIHIDAIAEQAASAGDVLELRNPASGKTFRARLEDHSRAVIVVGGTETL